MKKEQLLCHLKKKLTLGWKMLYLHIILGDMIVPLKVFLSVRKWEMQLLNIIWVKCIMKVDALVVPETMP